MKYQDVVVPQSKNAIMITLAIKKDVALDEVRVTIRDFCDKVPAIVNSMRSQHPDDQFNFAFGFGASAWKTLFPKTTPPKELKEFEEIIGPKKTAVSTPGDLFFI